MLKFNFTRSGVAAIGKNNLRRIGRTAIEKCAEHWFKTYLPMHFKNTAYRRYGYKWRDPRTNKLKRQQAYWPFGDNDFDQRAIGEVLPLVWSGRTRASALGNKRIKPKAISFERYEAKVSIIARVLNFARNKRIDMRDELTRINNQELKALQQRFAMYFERGIRDFKKTKTKRG